MELAVGSFLESGLSYLIHKVYEKHWKMSVWILMHTLEKHYSYLDAIEYAISHILVWIAWLAACVPYVARLIDVWSGQRVWDEWF